ncbi:hypothetical protein ACQKMD_07980 [Viridibacillus sp. NPDC096237]|uniref:hypothetical protein n=1 Tax=Viridibacillus sp. NPDC096237 TaxID=3390721 RepID=UPI003CFF21CE
MKRKIVIAIFLTFILVIGISSNISSNFISEEKEPSILYNIQNNKVDLNIEVKERILKEV